MRRMPVVVVVGLTLAACGLSPDAAPRDLPADENDPIPQQLVTGGEAEGQDRIYLGAPGEDRLLRSVPREASSNRDLIEILFAGPNEEELNEQFTTFLPAGLELRQVVKQGPILFLDVGPQLIELQGQPLTQALAQIVYTATELEGVDRVQIRVDGASVSLPRATGANTTGALSVYDYPGFVQSTQPPYPALPST